jgi:hypothetical protein
MQVAKAFGTKPEDQDPIMGTERTIHTLLSVFDLKIIDGSNLEELASARIVFVSDQNKNVREFSIVDSKMPHEFQDRLRTWLEKNMDPVEIAGTVNSKTFKVMADPQSLGDVVLH